MSASGTAVITTDRASRYLQQLAKHFEHKLPVSFTPEAGTITFGIGVCAMTAQDGRLTLSVTAPDHAQLPQLQDVVERHLVRFAFREELALDWQPA